MIMAMIDKYSAELDQKTAIRFGPHWGPNQSFSEPLDPNLFLST